MSTACCHKGSAVIRIFLSFKERTEKGNQDDHGNHGGDEKRIFSEKSRGKNGAAQTDEGRRMVLFLHPLFQEDYQEQGSHDKADSFRIERKHSSQDAVQSSACDPVKIVEERNPEIEPAFIDIIGDGRRIIQSKGFIAEHKDQKGLFPAEASVLLHESNAVKKMAGLDGEGNEQSLQRSKGDSSMVTATNSRGTAEDDHGHNHGG